MEYIIKGTKWKIGEVGFVKRMYRSSKKKAILKKIKGRSWKSIANRAQILGIRRVTIKPNHWTEKENRIIKTKYSKKTKEELLKLLTDRTGPAITGRACTLKLRKEGRPYTPKYRKDVKSTFWSKRELKRLIKYYPNATENALIRLLPKRHWNSIKVMAHKNGLTRWKKWSEKELAIIKEYYDAVPTDKLNRRKLEKLLPNRNWEQILKKYSHQRIKESKHGVVD